MRPCDHLGVARLLTRGQQGEAKHATPIMTFVRKTFGSLSFHLAKTPMNFHGRPHRTAHMNNCSFAFCICQHILSVFSLP